VQRRAFNIHLVLVESKDAHNSLMSLLERNRVTIMGVRSSKDLIEHGPSLDDVLAPTTTLLVYDISVRCNMKLPALLNLMHSVYV